MKTHKHISVVVCTYNRSGLLERALTTLLHQATDGTFSYDIVVVDDASTDETEKVAKALMADAAIPMYYVRGSGRGVAAARNVGLDVACGDWLAFFDDDQLADKRWLLELWRAQEASGAQCIGGSRSLDLPPDQLNQLSRIVRLILGEVPVEARARSCTRKDTLCTGNAMIHRSVIERVGRFDDALVQGGEDTEFFMRVRGANIDCFYTPHALVRHIIPAYRLEEKYLVWAAVRGGVCFAHRDRAEYGAARTLLLATARAGQACLVHGVIYGLSMLRGDAAEALGRKCHLRRAGAYIAQSVRFLVSPVDVSERQIVFRSERKLFQNP